MLWFNGEGSFPQTDTEVMVEDSAQVSSNSKRRPLMMVQWGGLSASNTRSAASVPGWGTKVSHARKKARGRNVLIRAQPRCWRKCGVGEETEAVLCEQSQEEERFLLGGDAPPCESLCT